MAGYRYDHEADVHVADCSGVLTLAVGIDRVRALQRELSRRPARGGIFKLLIDFRETIWPEPSVHREMSRVTRDELGLTPDNARVRLAIVNQSWAGQPAANERWFLSSAEALEWLCR